MLYNGIFCEICEHQMTAKRFPCMFRLLFDELLITKITTIAVSDLSSQ